MAQCFLASVRRRRGATAMSNRAIRITMIVIATVGLGVASYLTYVHYSGIQPICSAGGSCLEVQTSIYSKIAGVPVALIGLIGYIVILGSLLVPESEETPLRDDGLHGRRLRLLRLPDLSRAVLDPRDLRVVRVERGHDDGARVSLDLAVPARRATAVRGRGGDGSRPIPRCRRCPRPALDDVGVVERYKAAAAQAAAELVADGERVGLGTGSTVAHLLPALAARDLRGVRCAATSPATERAGARAWPGRGLAGRAGHARHRDRRRRPDRPAGLADQGRRRGADAREDRRGRRAALRGDRLCREDRRRRSRRRYQSRSCGSERRRRSTRSRRRSCARSPPAPTAT